MNRLEQPIGQALPACAVRGSLHGGRAMCGAVIMSSGKCGSDKPCQHKVEPPKTCLGCGAKQQPDGSLPCGH